MGSALGEMFDHGCGESRSEQRRLGSATGPTTTVMDCPVAPTDHADAINTTLEVILCSHALGLGRSWWTVASQVATLCNFYASTWVHIPHNHSFIFSPHTPSHHPSAGTSSVLTSLALIARFIPNSSR
jgi:hypothetical protein